MNREYVREASGVYLVLNDVRSSEFREKMVLGCEGKYLLPVRERHLNGKSSYYYDVRAKQAMSESFDGCGMGEDFLRSLFSSLVQTVELLREHLLEPENLLLEPEYIMLQKDLEPCFCLCPEKSRQGGPVGLAQFILEHVNNDDAGAVRLAYGFYESATENSFELTDLLKCETTPADTGLPFDENETEGSVEKSFYYRDEDDDNEVETVNTGKLWPLIVCGVLIIISGAAYIYIFIHPRLLARAGIRQEDYIVAGAILTTILACIVIGVLQICLHVSADDTQESSGDKECENDLPAVSSDDPEWNEYMREEPAEAEDDDDETVILSVPVERTCACLVGRSGKERTCFELDKSPYHIGKQTRDNDGVLRLPGISRRHAVLEKSAAGWFIKDLNSTNGVMVNNSFLPPGQWQALSSGDEVCLGEHRFVFTE